MGITYYLGVQLGLALRFPPAATSLLWPPNALLAVAFLLTPARLWWVCLAGALPVHVLVQAPLGWHWPMIIGLFLTNSLEAVIAAVGIRTFSDAPLRFDTLRRVAVLLLAAGIAAPTLSSFADAAVVHAFQGEPYWTIWRTREFSNVLTELSVVPLALLIARAAARNGLRSFRRVPEAVVFALTLTAGAVVLFWARETWHFVPLERTSTAFLLPFFLWGALRFGVEGISATLFVAALIASAAARLGMRSYEDLAPVDGLLALQLRLVLTSGPLFILAALVDERRKALSDLTARVRFEALLARLSGSFVHVPSDQMPAVFATCLQQIGEFTTVDRVAIWLASGDEPRLHLSQEWCVPGSNRPPDRWSIADLQVEAPPDAEGPILVRFEGAGVIEGGMSFGVSRSSSRPDRSRLSAIVDVFASALVRKQAEDIVRSSESTNAAILDSLSNLVAVVDRSGTIVATNTRWSDDGAGTLVSGTEIGLGSNFLDACQAAAARGHAAARAAAAGADDVLQGRREAFFVENQVVETGRWYAMSIVPLRRREGGAVVSFVDVTERHRAELSVYEARQELAQLNRVLTMGQLTANLAHELNQPLTGILTNAQTALRYLERQPPDLDGVRAVLTDIVDDDRRVAAAIRRTRESITKVGGERTVVDINDVLRDVGALAAVDLGMHRVTLMLDLCVHAPRVHADRIELCQVLLNVLSNAVHAVEAQPAPDRMVLVSSEVSEGHVLVSVRDSGCGVPPGTDADMFEPFVTDRAGGTGMGLAVARSIIDAHDGRIWAEPNAPRGAAFFIRLPLVS